MVAFGLIGGAGVLWWVLRSHSGLVVEHSDLADIQSEMLPIVESLSDVPSENIPAIENQSHGPMDATRPAPLLDTHAQPVVVPSGETVSATQANKEATSFAVLEKLVRFGFSGDVRKTSNIDTVVLHSSFNNQGGDRYAVDTVIEIWKSYGVAPHFLIDRAGVVYRLVSEKHIAYHAGVSAMPDGRENVNNFSLGVEILNAEDDAYTKAQYQAVRDLLAYLKKTYPITHVVGHADIAPGRKSDPWNFDWERVK